MIKRLFLSLLLVLCCHIAGAQNKSEVLVVLKETIYDYFLPDFNLAVEESGWRDPQNANGLVSASKAYIEPNHFFRNGKVCTSYTDWVNQYCGQSLNGKVIEHALTLSENLQKVSGNNDLYRIDATLSRRWVNGDGPTIPAEKINITFLWRGAEKLVHIMHLDGNISPVKLPEPVKNTTPQKTEEKVTVINADSDYISDSSLVGFFLEECYKQFREIRTAFYASAIILLLGVFIFTTWDYIKTQKKDGDKIYWWMPIILTCRTYIIGMAAFLFYLFGMFLYICTDDDYKPSRIRLEYLKSYDSYRIFGQQGKATVSKDGKWGIVDFNGNVTCSLVFDSITSVSGNWAIAQSDNKYTLVPLQSSISDLKSLKWYSNISPFMNGKSIVEDKGVYYLFNSNVAWNLAWEKLPYKVISFEQANLNVYKCRKSRRDGIINGEGKEIVPTIYKYISNFSEGLAVIMNENFKNGYIDKEGNIIIPLEYNAAKDFKEGLAPVEDKKYRWGYIDKNGKVVIPFKYHNAWSFSEGLALVGNDMDYVGYIDRNNKLIIPFKFLHASDFKDGKAEVWYSHKKSGYIDKNGKPISSNQ